LGRVAGVTIRAIRGATCLSADDPVEMTEAVSELMRAIVNRNGVTEDDMVSIFLTCTPDLVSGFPAAAVRTIGYRDVPLMCAQEMNVAGALAHVVRVMAHVNTDLARADIQHVYLRGAEVLRADLASKPATDGAAEPGGESAP